MARSGQNISILGPRIMMAHEPWLGLAMPMTWISLIQLVLLLATTR
jgi:hypothetical protein